MTHQYGSKLYGKANFNPNDGAGGVLKCSWGGHTDQEIHNWLDFRYKRVRPLPALRRKRARGAIYISGSYGNAEFKIPGRGIIYCNSSGRTSQEIHNYLRLKPRKLKIARAHYRAKRSHTRRRVRRHQRRKTRTRGRIKLWPLGQKGPISCAGFGRTSEEIASLVGLKAQRAAVATLKKEIHAAEDEAREVAAEMVAQRVAATIAAQRAAATIAAQRAAALEAKAIREERPFPIRVPSNLIKELPPQMVEIAKSAPLAAKQVTAKLKKASIAAVAQTPSASSTAASGVVGSVGDLVVALAEEGGTGIVEIADDIGNAVKNTAKTIAEAAENAAETTAKMARDVTSKTVAALTVRMKGALATTPPASEPESLRAQEEEDVEGGASTGALGALAIGGGRKRRRSTRRARRGAGRRYSRSYRRQRRKRKIRNGLTGRKYR